eukprot:scaffold100_cov357-Prasinococcus_capsulatus_cf.AAC.13
MVHGMLLRPPVGGVAVDPTREGAHGLAPWASPVDVVMAQPSRLLHACAHPCQPRRVRRQVSQSSTPGQETHALREGRVTVGRRLVPRAMRRVAATSDVPLQAAAEPASSGTNTLHSCFTSSTASRSNHPAHTQAQRARPTNSGGTLASAPWYPHAPRPPWERLPPTILLKLAAELTEVLALRGGRGIRELRLGGGLALWHTL